MKIDKLKPGMTVYDVHSHKMGNTTIRTVGVCPVKIVKVGIEKSLVLARWNVVNPPEWYGYATFSKWVAEEPIIVRSLMGSCRKPSRAEKAVIDRAAWASSSISEEMLRKLADEVKP